MNINNFIIIIYSSFVIIIINIMIINYIYGCVFNFNSIQFIIIIIILQSI